MRRQSRNLRAFWLIALALTVLGQATADAPAQQAQSNGQGITSIAFSSDGKTLAAGLENGRIPLWNPQTGLERRVLSDQDGLATTGVAFSPQDKTLTSVGMDSVVHRWNAATGTQLQALTAHQGPVLAVAASPDGKTVASAGQDTRIALWDVTAGKLNKILEGHADFVNALAFSPDGKTLASGGADRRLILWDVATGQPRQILLGATQAITSVAFSADGGTLASASSDGSAQLWDPVTGQQSQTLRGATNQLRTLAFSPDGKTLVGAGDEGVLFAWDPRTGKTLQALRASDKAITAVAFSPDGKTLASGDQAGVIVLLDAATGQPRRTLKTGASSDDPAGDQGPQALAPSADVPLDGQQQADAATMALAASEPSVVIMAPVGPAGQGPGAPDFVNAVAFSPDGKTVASALQSGDIRLFDSASGKQKLNLPAAVRLPATGVAFGPGASTLISVGRDSVLRRWNAAGQQIQLLTGHEHAIRAVAASPDGTTVASAGEDTRIAVWNMVTGKLSRLLAGHVNFVNTVAFGPDGRILASGGEDGRIIIWDSATGRQVRTLLGHEDGVTSVAISPNGAILASASKDRSVRLWDLATGLLRGSLSGPTKRVRTVAFSPDGATLIGAGDDTLLFQWDVATGKPRGALAGPKKSVTQVAFSRDGGTLASVDEGSQVILFDTTRRQPRVIIPIGSAPALQKTQDTGGSAAVAKMAGVARVSAAAPTPSGNAILVVTNPADPFSDYYQEMLRTEGLNVFSVAPIGSVTPATLGGFDVVILSAMALTPAQVGMFTDWVTTGGNLIAIRPDKQLAGLLGLSDAGSTLSEGYLLVDTSKAPGNGLANQTLQFHGAADSYTVNGATRVAVLYSNATTATPNLNPAVTLARVGAGQAAAFTYDLARSLVFTRQGNPAWATQERDGFTPKRSDDKYYGNAVSDPQPDWVDLSKVAIPQADEQQRLLANLILTMNKTKKPLPRFWYFPNGKKAVVVMTGDDHANGGTVGRFDQYKAGESCSVTNWECIRGTSYIYPNTPFSDQQASAYNAAGFEIGLHINTGCADFTPASLEAVYVDQLASFKAAFPSLPDPTTERHHCIVWSDWLTSGTVELNHGIRLDTSYYYWPPGWIQDRPGLFNGSGIPMRLADTDGTLIDVREAATPMTDESGQSYPLHVDSLLDRALGAEGYYGAFVVNAHTDYNPSPVSDAVVASAKARAVPIVSARQMLTWLDGRESSSFDSLSWANGNLSFAITAGSGTSGLQAMLPANSAAGILSALTRNGDPVAFTTQALKGIDYAVFTATSGAYVATYAMDTLPPTVASTSPVPGATGVSAGTSVTATFSEAIDPATVNVSTFTLRDATNALVAAAVSYDPATKTAMLKPNASLAFNSTYTASLSGGTVDPRIKDLSGNALNANYTWSFATQSVPCTQPCSLWASTTVPGNAEENDPNAVELGVMFKSDISGFVRGVRFYKGPGNTGTHTGTLWSSAGKKLKTATFSGESSSGWQQVNFSAPVAITANTVYIVSYHTNVGRYAFDNFFFASAGTDNAPLHALQNGVSGGNGVYRYGASAFPNSTYQSTNYWVDLVFTRQ